MLSLKIEGKEYELEEDPQDPFIVPGLMVAYDPQLAKDFLPILLDFNEYGSKPYPPKIIGYRLVVNQKSQRLCILYEVYWKRQDCTWKELNKDHDHDYEQIQIHFNIKTGEREKVIISSIGPVEYAGHGVEVYSHIFKAKVKDVEYTTSPKKWFPWGGDKGQNNVTQVREIPMKKSIFKGKRPIVLVINCYHAFVGLKRKSLTEKMNELKPRLEKLNRELLEKWYYHHAKNRFGHDISKPFDEPYIMYYPPPEDIKSRIVYFLLWLIACLKRRISIT